MPKSELLSALPDTGYAVLNADDEYTPLLESFAHLAERGVTVHSYGFSPEAETHAQNVSYDAEACASFEIVTGDAAPGGPSRLACRAGTTFSTRLQPMRPVSIWA